MRYDGTCGRSRMVGDIAGMNTLTPEVERAAARDHQVGVVFPDAGSATALEMLVFVGKRFRWLEQLDEQVRPFAHRVTLSDRSHAIVL